MNNIESSAAAKANNKPTSEELAEYYPYPAIPHSVRSFLERDLQISDINSATPTNSREINRLNRLSVTNQVLGLTRAYCRAELNGSAYKAAALGGLEDGASGLGERAYSSSRAREELGRFFIQNAADYGGDIYNERNVYIAGLLRDRKRLDAFRQLARSSDDPIDYERGAPAPSREEWLADPEIVSADTLYDAVNSINIESMLISGCETLARLRNYHENDRETLDLVRYSERLIAPVAEVIGFDTLAMSLNSTTKSIRLKNGGEEYLLHRADALIDRYRGANRANNLAQNVALSVNGIIYSIFGEPSAPLNIVYPVDYGDDNQAVYGDIKQADILADGEMVSTSWRFRLKTPGSLAWKLHKELQKGKDLSIMPMDVLGITVIAQDNDAQRQLFQAAVNGMTQSPDITPHHSPSKKSWAHVRGTTDYIDQLTAGLDQTRIDQRVAQSADDLRYGKVTGFYRDEPFELQCVTRDVRDSMQIGPLAHVIYKASGSGRLTKDEVARWTELLSDLRRRRNHIGEAQLLTQFSDAQRSELGVERDAEAYIEEAVSSVGAVGRALGAVALDGRA